VRGLRSDRRGLSEIVGSLFLVLIVVGAATALSVFVASYQKQLQSEEALNHDRNLEAITVLHLRPTLEVNHTSDWGLLNFSLASLDVNPMVVTGVSLNDQALQNYTAWALDLSTGDYTTITVGPGGQLPLDPREQVNVLVDVVAGNNSSFYDRSTVLAATDYIKIDVFTALQNDFGRVFIPPTAIALVAPLETLSNSSTYESVPILDGSSSFQPGNATIIQWNWSVSNAGNVSYFTGEKVADHTMVAGKTYTILLTVTNSDGLLGTDSIPYSA
jgi:flagellin-like protein